MQGLFIMKTIYKYTVSRLGKITLQKDARFLKLELINGEVLFWFLVDTDNENETRTFGEFGTGWDLGPDAPKYVYLDTVIDSNEFVWHWFEIT